MEAYFGAVKMRPPSLKFRETDGDVSQVAVLTFEVYNADPTVLRTLARYAIHGTLIRLSLSSAQMEMPLDHDQGLVQVPTTVEERGP